MTRHDRTAARRALLIVATALWHITGLYGPACRAVDKSGVTPNTISLPQGPGSIEGLGESFQPTLNTGTAKYGVRLAVPPGTAGHAPSLSLQYDGGGSNGPLGFGWSLGIPFVQRQTDKGIPRYVDGDNNVDDDDGLIDEPDEIDVFINELKEELVPTVDGFYFCENEGPFIRYRRVKDENHDHWEGTMPDGTLMEFGLTAGARTVDADTGRIFCWMLEKMTDTNGNTIVYSYTSVGGEQDTNKRYLHKIEYGPGSPPWENLHFAFFEYENRPDWFEDCRSGFVVRTGRRIKAIVVGTQGPTLVDHNSGDFNRDGQTDYLNREYHLSYEAHSHWSLLTSVAWIGADGKSTYPPLVFRYTVADPSDEISASGQIIGSVDTPVRVMDNDLVDLVDLNGDGLPDVLDTGGPRHTAYLNRGEVNNNGEKAIVWSYAPEVAGEHAWEFNLASTGNIAHLADMDADGVADFVCRSTAGDVFYFRNQATLSWGPWSAMSVGPDGSVPPSPFGGAANVKTADLDFNKHMDIIQSIDEGFRYKIWFNLGNQTFSKMVSVGQDIDFMLSDADVHIADFNGDRVADVVRIRPTELQVMAGLGYGKFAALSTVDLPDYTLDTPEVKKARLQDVTGDGLVDLVIERVSGCRLWYWINLGNYTLDRRRIISDMPKGLGENPEIRWADLNGNGTTDLVYADRYDEPRIQTVDIGRLIGCVPKPNMLISIDNGIGRKTTIEYATSTRYLLVDQARGHTWPYALPFPVSVVSKVVVDDSMGNFYTAEFCYHDGYYDGNEKEFRGFAAVEKKDIGEITAPDLIMAYTFDTGAESETLKGKILGIEARNADGEVFWGEDNTWATRKLSDSANGDGRSVTFGFQEEKTRQVIEKGNGTPVQLKWEYEYDNYGNMIRHVEHGRLDLGWDDERVTEMSYTAAYASGLSRWILDKVVEQSISDEDATLASHQRNFYDGEVALGTVTSGNLTIVEDRVSAGEYVVSVRNDYDAYGNVVAIYDPLYGVESGHYREIAYETSFYTYPVREVIYTGKPKPSSLTMSAAYDFGLGVITLSTDLNGFQTHYRYDAFARLKSIQEPGDTAHTAEYEYVLACDLTDGKMINWVESRQRDGSAGDGFLHCRTYYDGLSRKIMVRAEGEVPGQILVSDTVQFNARRLPWKKYLPYFDIGTLDFTEPEFNNGFTQHFYDALGRLIRLNQPAGSEGVVYSTTTYEPLCRTVRDEEQTKADSPHFGCGMRYVQDGLQDEDGKGRLREVYEIVNLGDSGEALGNTVEWRTIYSYDLLGNLTEYTDSQGNKGIFQYDGLSRKTLINDPDRGQIHYTYDEANNLIRKVDAKGQTIEYAYDGVNRVKAEYYGERKTEPDVEYHYDVPFGPVDRGELWQSQSDQAKMIAGAILDDKYYANHELNNDGRIDVADVIMAARNDIQDTTVTARNTLGFLAWVRDRSGEEHNSYDERGRVEWIVKRIIDKERDDLNNFFTAMEYDSMDRVKMMTYPDGIYVRYTYNSRGLLESIPNVIDQYEYNPFGQNALLQLACGTVTTYAYDHRLRLSRLHTVRSRDGLILQDMNYTYDAVSNLTSVIDGRTEAQLDQIGTELGIGSSKARDFDATQSFTYDCLYRLIQASNPCVYGTIDYRYDRIGNMIKKSASLIDPDPIMDLGTMVCGATHGTAMRAGRNRGDPPGPHAVTGTEKGPAGPMTFSYDDNGNMISHGMMSLSWDYMDRLVGVVHGRKNAQYTYDYANIRKSKIVNDSNTPSDQTVVHYIDKFSEIRDDKLIKFVYAGNNRIARCTSGNQSSSLLAGSFYFHDHLGSTSLVADNSGTVVQATVFYPFGIRRNQARCTGWTKTHYKFTGKEEDDESGMYYFGARYYGSSLGRFLSVDPLSQDTTALTGDPQAVHSYSYGRSNPLTFGDLKGMLKVKVNKSLEVILIPDGSTIKGEEDWASKMSLAIYKDPSAYKTKFKPTPQALAEQGLGPGQEAQFDYNNIKAGVETFIDLEATAKLRKAVAQAVARSTPKAVEKVLPEMGPQVYPKGPRKRNPFILPKPPGSGGTLLERVNPKRDPKPRTSEGLAGIAEKVITDPGVQSVIAEVLRDVLEPYTNQYGGTEKQEGETIFEFEIPF